MLVAVVAVAAPAACGHGGATDAAPARPPRPPPTSPGAPTPSPIEDAAARPSLRRPPGGSAATVWGDRPLLRRLVDLHRGPPLGPRDAPGRRRGGRHRPRRAALPGLRRATASPRRTTAPSPGASPSSAAPRRGWSPPRSPPPPPTPGPRTPRASAVRTARPSSCAARPAARPPRCGGWTRTLTTPRLARRRSTRGASRRPGRGHDPSACRVRARTAAAPATASRRRTSRASRQLRLRPQRGRRVAGAGGDDGVPVGADTAARFRGHDGDEVRVYCPPGGAARTVWGTRVYTYDSSVCTAAVHAGLATFDAAASSPWRWRGGSGGTAVGGARRHHARLRRLPGSSRSPSLTARGRRCPPPGGFAIMTVTTARAGARSTR